MKFLIYLCALIALASCAPGHRKHPKERPYYSYYEDSDNYYDTIEGDDVELDYYPEYYSYDDDYYSDEDSSDENTETTTTSNSGEESVTDSGESSEEHGIVVPSQPGNKPPLFGVIQISSSQQHQTVICYGTIIDEDWALSTADCPAFSPHLSDYDDFSNYYYDTGKADKVKVSVRLGRSKSARRIPVSKIVKHPHFDKRTGKNNVALLKIARPVPKTAVVKLSTKIRSNNDGFIAFNTNKEGRPRTVVLKAVETPSCKPHGRNQFCVRAVGRHHPKSCPTSSPFIAKGKLRGLYSSGDPCKEGAVFTDLKDYKNFIARVTRKKLN